jgi:hypothetical protein
VHEDWNDSSSSSSSSSGSSTGGPCQSQEANIKWAQHKHNTQVGLTTLVRMLDKELKPFWKVLHRKIVTTERPSSLAVLALLYGFSAGQIRVTLRLEALGGRARAVARHPECCVYCQVRQSVILEANKTQ